MNSIKLPSMAAGLTSVREHRGISVAFLGIDGIGKSTVCRAFEKRLRASGLEVATVAWRSTLEDSTAPWPAVPLQQLWLESFRALYGGGLREGEPIPIPASYDEWKADGWERHLAARPVTDNRAAGPLAAALVVIAANILLAAEVARPALERGAIVVQESHPLKLVLKHLAVAERLSQAGRGENESVGELVRAVRSSLELVFDSELMRPDITILIDGPASYAYRWRTAQNGAVGALEDYAAAGVRSEESFVLMQSEVGKLLREYAGPRGWIHHVVDDTGVEANTERALDALCAHPLLAGRLSHAGMASGERRG